MMMQVIPGRSPRHEFAVAIFNRNAGRGSNAIARLAEGAEPSTLVPGGSR